MEFLYFCWPAPPLCLMSGDTIWHRTFATSHMPECKDKPVMPVGTQCIRGTSKFFLEYRVFSVSCAVCLVCRIGGRVTTPPGSRCSVGVCCGVFIWYLYTILVAVRGTRADDWRTIYFRRICSCTYSSVVVWYRIFFIHPYLAHQYYFVYTWYILIITFTFQLNS